MNLPGLLFLIVAQFLAGRGILAMFKVKLRPLISFAVSSIIGIVVFSLLPMLIEMFHMPITKSNVILFICAATLLLNIFVIKRYDFGVFKQIKIKFPPIYELLFIVLFIALAVPSLWRCYYYPPNARDVMSGPEALAEYAVKEHTINNSVWSVNLLESTPNLLKPPFITDLQIIYKLLVHPFGQIWLSIMYICFSVWLYSLVREKLHPFLTGIVMLFFLTIPEVYGYTYIILWDYSNMILFFLGFYYMYQYIVTKEYNLFLFSCFMYGLATFIRLDTLVFIALSAPLLAYHMWKGKEPFLRIGYSVVLMGAIPFVFYYVWVNIFVKNYLPIGIDVEQQLNPQPLSIYFDWLSGMNSQLLFGGDNIALYGYFIYIFLLILVIDIIFFRRFSKEAIFMLFGIAIIYFGMPLLSYLTTWFNITTAKRGFFKMFPMMILYMRSSALFTRLSQLITSFEFPTIQEAIMTPKAQAVKHTNTVKKKK